MRTIRTLTAGLMTLALLASMALGAVAQSPPATLGMTAPIEFSGRISSGSQTSLGTEASVDGHLEVRGDVFAPAVEEMSDPRLDGSVTVTLDINTYPVPGTEEDVTIRWLTWRIENESGAWEGPQVTITFPDATSTSTAVLTGDGAYAGLVAAWEMVRDGKGWDVRGFIVPG